MSKSRILDQFYTKPHIAKMCFEKALSIIAAQDLVFDNFLEPSAGTGSFYNLLPENKLGIDLEPKTEGVIESDFFEFNDFNGVYFTIGNPPFGKNSSLAIRFFNKCAIVSVAIGFIVPKTFKKESVKNKLDLYFHLVYEEDLADNSFEFNGQDKDVPCVFQVWVKRDVIREKAIKLTTEDFTFCKERELADFAFQRVGVNAGRIKDIDNVIASASHYFMKQKNENVREILSGIDWNSVKLNTAGNPSISKQELIMLYNQHKSII